MQRLGVRANPMRATYIRARAEPSHQKPAPLPFEEDLYLALAIKSANNICMSTLDDMECTFAWDTVDEIVRGLHHRHEFDIVDPLEAFCAVNPDADECRTYDV